MDQQPTQPQPIQEIPVTPVETIPQNPSTKSFSPKHHKIINSVLAIILFAIVSASVFLWYQKQPKKISDQCPLKISPCPTANIIKGFPDYPNILGLQYAKISAGTKIIAIDSGIISTGSAILPGRKQIVLNDLKGHSIFYSIKGNPQIIDKNPSNKVIKGEVLAITGLGETSSLFLTAQGASRSSILLIINPNQTLKPF